MNIYIFYTDDGYTQDINGNDMENCQVLGWANGIDPSSAYAYFKEKNEFLITKFDRVLCQELLSENIYYFSFKQ